MAASSSIKAGQAYVEVTIRDKLTQGLRSAQAKLMAFGNAVRAISTAVAGIGVAGLTGLLSAAKHFADTGSEMHDMSVRTGVAADKLSELKFAAEQSGASLEDVERALRFMQKHGIAADKFDEIAKGIAAIEDPTERTQAALAIFGKTGTRLLPMLSDLAVLSAQARQLGVVINPQQASAADDLGDAFGRLKAAMSGVWLQLGASIAPALTRILDVLSMGIVGMTEAVIKMGTAFTQQISAMLTSALAAGRAFAAITGVKAIDDGVNAIQGALAALKAITGPALFPKLSVPDIFDGMLGESKGATSRGQFGGNRAESLGIGTGGGTLEKLNDLKAILERINVNIERNVKATEAIEEPEFD